LSADPSLLVRNARQYGRIFVQSTTTTTAGPGQESLIGRCGCQVAMALLVWRLSFTPADLAVRKGPDRFALVMMDGYAIL
jgi:hypothetical protein